LIVADLLREIMRGAFDLNGQACGRAIEVQNVRADWVLSAKPEPGHVSAAERLPEQDFRQGHLRAQLSRALEG